MRPLLMAKMESFLKIQYYLVVYYCHFGWFAFMFSGCCWQYPLEIHALLEQRNPPLENQLFKFGP
jgi:hypothetical protein